MQGYRFKPGNFWVEAAGDWREVQLSNLPDGPSLKSPWVFNDGNAAGDKCERTDSVVLGW